MRDFYTKQKKTMKFFIMFVVVEVSVLGCLANECRAVNGFNRRAKHAWLCRLSQLSLFRPITRDFFFRFDQISNFRTSKQEDFFTIHFIQ